MAKIKDVKKQIDILKERLENQEELTLQPVEIAKLLKNLHKIDEDLFKKYLRMIPGDLLGEVVLEFSENFLKDVLDELPVDVLAEAIEEMQSDDATDLIQDIEDIDETKAQEIFENLDKEDQDAIKKLRQYSDDQAGAYMQTELFRARYDEKIGDSIKRLRAQLAEGYLYNVHNVYVTGKYGRLLFVIALDKLITFDFEQTYEEALDEREAQHEPLAVHDEQDIDEVARMFEEHALVVVPVIDKNGILLGRITSDDIYEVIQESATEQIYNLAGVSEEAEEESLAKAGKNRGLWLFINLLTALAASMVIGLFDDTIEQYVALAVLMPIVASMGGNAGTQTLTVFVRKLALGEIDSDNAKDAVKKEIFLASANGVGFGILLAIIAILWFGNLTIGWVICASMVLNTLAAGVFGGLIPLLLKRTGIDPAVGSSVILTTVTDIVGFLSFLGLAKLML